MGYGTDRVSISDGGFDLSSDFNRDVNRCRPVQTTASGFCLQYRLDKKWDKVGLCYISTRLRLRL